jgi:hypothetical protein
MVTWPFFRLLTSSVASIWLGLAHFSGEIWCCTLYLVSIVVHGKRLISYMDLPHHKIDGTNVCSEVSMLLNDNLLHFFRGLTCEYCGFWSQY